MEFVSQLVPDEGVSRIATKSVVARHCYLKLSLDGNRWCALFGDNLQDGVAGFGDTPNDAVAEFESEFKTSHDRPPVPSTAFDWSAWIDGREEWKTGRGPTEAAAIRDLLEEIEG
jgi:hypothetical protein